MAGNKKSVDIELQYLGSISPTSSKKSLSPEQILISLCQVVKDSLAGKELNNLDEYIRKTQSPPEEQSRLKRARKEETRKQGFGRWGKARKILKATTSDTLSGERSFPEAPDKLKHILGIVNKNQGLKSSIRENFKLWDDLLSDNYDPYSSTDLKYAFVDSLKHTDILYLIRSLIEYICQYFSSHPDKSPEAIKERIAFIEGCIEYLPNNQDLAKELLALANRQEVQNSPKEEPRVELLPSEVPKEVQVKVEYPSDLLKNGDDPTRYDTIPIPIATSEPEPQETNQVEESVDSTSVRGKFIDKVESGVKATQRIVEVVGNELNQFKEKVLRQSSRNLEVLQEAAQNAGGTIEGVKENGAKTAVETLNAVSSAVDKGVATLSSTAGKVVTNLKQQFEKIIGSQSPIEQKTSISSDENFKLEEPQSASEDKLVPQDGVLAPFFDNPASPPKKKKRIIPNTPVIHDRPDTHKQDSPAAASSLQQDKLNRLEYRQMTYVGDNEPLYSFNSPGEEPSTTQVYLGSWDKIPPSTHAPSSNLKELSTEERIMDIINATEEKLTRVASKTIEGANRVGEAFSKFFTEKVSLVFAPGKENLSEKVEMREVQESPEQNNQSVPPSTHIQVKPVSDAKPVHNLGIKRGGWPGL